MNKGYLGNYGEYEHTGKRFSLLDARLSFIYAIADKFPNVFDALHDEPLKTYQNTSLLSIDSHSRADFWFRCIGCLDSTYYLDGVYKYKGYEDDIQFYNLPPTGGKILHLKDSPPWHYAQPNLAEPEYERTKKELLPPLITWWKSLRRWANSFHLNEGWMLHFAFLKLDSYAEGDKGRDYIYTYRYDGLTDYFGPDVQPRLVEPVGLYRHAAAVKEEIELEPFNFSYQAWRPELTNESVYRRYVREVCKRDLDAYMKQAKERIHSNPKIEKIPEKKDADHYELLARFQCGEESIENLHRQVNLARETVRDAIHNTAQLIGLNLRKPNKGGRPKGSKDKSPRRVVRSEKTDGEKRKSG